MNVWSLRTVPDPLESPLGPVERADTSPCQICISPVDQHSFVAATQTPWSRRAQHQRRVAFIRNMHASAAVLQVLLCTPMAAWPHPLPQASLLDCRTSMASPAAAAVATCTEGQFFSSAAQWPALRPRPTPSQP